MAANRVRELRQCHFVLAECFIEAIELPSLGGEGEVSGVNAQIISRTPERVFCLCKLRIGLAESVLGIPTLLFGGVVIGMQAQQVVISRCVIVLLLCRLTICYHGGGGGVAVKYR